MDNLELEVDEGGDVFAAEFDDELDDDDEYQQFDYPRRANEGCGGFAPEVGRQSVGDDDDEHHYQPQHASRGERQRVVKREIGEGIFDNQP